MDSELWSLILSGMALVVSVVLGAWAQRTAKEANNKADEANELSSKSNEIAAQSRDAAESSARSAQESAEAARGTLDLERERFKVENRAQLKVTSGQYKTKDSGVEYMLTVTNPGPKPATDVHVSIRQLSERYRDGEGVGENRPQLAPNDQHPMEIVLANTTGEVRYALVRIRYSDYAEHTLEAYCKLPPRMNDVNDLPMASILQGVFLDADEIPRGCPASREVDRVGIVEFIRDNAKRDVGL